MKKIIVVLFLLTFSNCFSQVSQEWTSRFNNSGSMVRNSVKSDSKGNIYVIGVNYNSLTGKDFLLIKYNSNGTQLWNRIFNDTSNADDIPAAFTIDSLGNAYITGTVNSGSSRSDIITLKYDSFGNLIWSARFNGVINRDDFSVSIDLDQTGNIYVGGGSNPSLQFSQCDYLVVKYNPQGIQEWFALYDGPISNSLELPYSMVADSFGNTFITGGSIGSSGSTSYFDFATVKFNSSGVQQWVKNYNSPDGGYDVAYAITLDNSNNVYITGESGSYYSYFTTIKYNTDGAQQWVSRYRGSGNIAQAESNSISVDNSGNVCVAGVSFLGGADRDLTIVKYNSQGVQQWVTNYNGTGNVNDWLSGMTIDNYGNTYITGTSADTLTNNLYVERYVTIKYSSSGEQKWLVKYDFAKKINKPSGILVTASNNIFVTGSSQDSSGNYSIATIKYSQTIGINNLSSEVPLQYSLSQNYPNPFNPATVISFQLPAAGFVKLKVFDLLGREVANLVNENLSAGSYKFDFNASALPSGIYFYKLETENFSETRKMVLVK